jgi:hypothetical protein
VLADGTPEAQLLGEGVNRKSSPHRSGVELAGSVDAAVDTAIADADDLQGKGIIFLVQFCVLRVSVNFIWMEFD